MTNDYTASRYLPIAWELFHRDSRLLAHRLAGATFKGLVAITRGGLIPASILARELDLRLIECLSIASYDDRVQNSEPTVLKDARPDLVGEGEGWLIVDDLVDSGLTARVAKRLMPKARFAVVYAKPKGVDAVDVYAVGVEADVWLLFPWDGELQPNEPLARRRSREGG